MLAPAPMLMLCMLKAKENPKFPQSFSHRHKHHKHNAWPQHGSKACYRCGKMPSHGKLECPATDAVCHNCGEKGHYGKVCRSSANSLNAVTTEEEESYFLGAMDAGKDLWTVQLSKTKKKCALK